MALRRGGRAERVHRQLLGKGETSRLTGCRPAVSGENATSAEEGALITILDERIHDSKVLVRRKNAIF